MYSRESKWLSVCSVVILFQSGSLHQNYTKDTCFLHEVNFMERFVTTTYRSHNLKSNEWFYEFISMYMYSLSVCRVSVFSRLSWIVLCRGNLLSAGFADVATGSFRETPQNWTFFVTYRHTFKNHLQKFRRSLPIITFNLICRNRSFDVPVYVNVSETSERKQNDMIINISAKHMT